MLQFAKEVFLNRPYKNGLTMNGAVINAKYPFKRSFMLVCKYSRGLEGFPVFQENICDTGKEEGLSIMVMLVKTKTG